MNLTVTTAPAREVVLLDEAKEHLRVPGCLDDLRIALHIQAAREVVEHILGRSIGLQTMMLKVSGFRDEIRLTGSPVHNVTSVNYYDGGVLKTLAPGYRVDVEPDQAFLRLDSGWPEVDARPDAVEITYTAGYTSETCPASIRSWILLMVGTLYENGEGSSDKPAQPSPFVDRLIDRHRTWSA